MITTHDKQAEISVLGSLIIDLDCQERIDLVLDEYFYYQENKSLIQAIKKVIFNKEPLEILIIKKYVQADELEVFKNIVEISFTSSSFNYYLNILKDCYKRRKLIETCKNAYHQAMQEDNINDLLENTENKLRAISEDKETDITPTPKIVMDTYNVIEERYTQLKKGNVSLPGIASGFVDLDSMLLGFENTMLYIIGARPSMGKTALALNILENQTLKFKKNVALFSLEMGSQAIMKRLFAQTSNIPSVKLKTGDLSDGEWQKLSEKMSDIYNAPLTIDDTSHLHYTEILAKCRKLKKQNKLDIVFIDHLSCMKYKGDVRIGTEENVRGLKNMAKELNVPVVLLSQMNRSNADRKDKRPTLTDLRETGAIEQDADIIMLLYRDDYYNPDTAKKNVTEVIIAKNRDGAIGTVQLSWNPQYTKFNNLYRG